MTDIFTFYLEEKKQYFSEIQAWIAQLVVHRLGTWEVRSFLLIYSKPRNDKDKNEVTRKLKEIRSKSNVTTNTLMLRESIEKSVEKHVFGALAYG